MKTTNISEATKIIILVATVIVVCILCAVGFKVTNSGKAGANTATDQFNGITSEYADVEAALYDNSIILGSEVVNLIKKIVENEYYISIEVATLDGSTRSYNYIYDHESADMTKIGADTKVPEHKSEYAYINSMAEFLGSVYQDSNDNIVCIRFEQQH